MSKIKITNVKNNTFEIEFKYASYMLPVLINSIIKSRIIIGASTDETYRKITLKGETISTLEEYIINNFKKTKKNGLSIENIVNMVKTLTYQLNYLIKEENTAILGYHPSSILVINNDTFILIDVEMIKHIENSYITITSPFTCKDFFVSPEQKNINNLPSNIHYKSCYFSLGLLIIYVLIGDDDYYKEYLTHTYNDKSEIKLKILNNLNTNPIKNTKIYWLLSRCLDEIPKNRSIILI